MTKTTFTPTQIQKLATAYRTTCSTEWKIRTNSVSAVQAFRTVMNAFPSLIKDWNTFYKISKRIGTKSSTRTTKRSRRTTRKSRRTTKRTTTWGKKRGTKRVLRRTSGRRSTLWARKSSKGHRTRRAA